LLVVVELLPRHLPVGDPHAAGNSIEHELHTRVEVGPVDDVLALGHHVEHLARVPAWAPAATVAAPEAAKHPPTRAAEPPATAVAAATGPLTATGRRLRELCPAGRRQQDQDPGPDQQQQPRRPHGTTSPIVRTGRLPVLWNHSRAQESRI